MRISDWSSDVCSSDLYAAQATASAQGQGDLFQCAAGMHDHRQVMLAGQLQLPGEVMPLQIAIECVQVEIQADLADGDRTVFVQPGRQCIDICRCMLRKKNRIDRKSTRLNSSH